MWAGRERVRRGGGWLLTRRHLRELVHSCISGTEAIILTTCRIPASTSPVVPNLEKGPKSVGLSLLKPQPW